MAKILEWKLLYLCVCVFMYVSTYAIDVDIHML